MNRHTAMNAHGNFFESEEEELRGQEAAWNFTFSFAQSLAVKSVVLLGIPDIIARNGPNSTLSLPDIAKELPSESPDMDVLMRIMRFLVAIKFFRATKDASDGDTRYGLTGASKWLLQRQQVSMAPFFLMENDEVAVAPWHHFHECVLEGGVAFAKANREHIWAYCSAHPDFNSLFNDAMAGNTRVVMKALLSTYRGFDNVSSVVDVGGGIGSAVAEIVRAHPHIRRAINYDLPHVVGTAPEFPGVEHIAGDMFSSVPPADCMFLKWILHDWNDDDCTKLLKICRRALTEKGKVVIVEVVLEDENGDAGQKRSALDRNIGYVMDLVMIAHTSGGRERTASEWERLLSGAGFSSHNIVALPTLQCVIEAFP